MSKVSVMGTLKCQDGKAEEMEAVLAAMVEAAGTEPGVEIYSYHRGDDNTYWFFALMSDGESMRTTARVKRCRQPWRPLDRSPPGHRRCRSPLRSPPWALIFRSG